MMKYLSDKYDCYLSKEAKVAVNNLVRQYGIDKDLAVVLIEQAWPEEMLYDLPEDVENESERSYR